MKSFNILKVSRVLHQSDRDQKPMTFSKSPNKAKEPMKRKIYPPFIENEYFVYQRKSIIKQNELFRKNNTKVFNSSRYQNLYSNKKNYVINRKDNIDKNQTSYSYLANCNGNGNSIMRYPNINQSQRNIKKLLLCRLNKTPLKSLKSIKDDWSQVINKDCDDNDLNVSFDSHRDNDRMIKASDKKNKDKSIEMFNMLYRQYKFFQSKPPVVPYYSYNSFYKEDKFLYSKKDILLKRNNGNNAKQKLKRDKGNNDVFNKTFQLKLKQGLTSRPISKKYSTYN